MKKILIGALLAAAAATPAIAQETAGTLQGADAATRGARPLRVPRAPDALATDPTDEDVGDADSFGRAVKFLGFRQTNGVTVQTDCSFYEPGHCATITDPAETTRISRIGDEAIIKLPGRSAKSLLCFTLTPLGEIGVDNSTSTPQNLFASFGAIWRIESEVLADPGLIDSATGLPFNGGLQSGQTLVLENRRIEAGAREQIFPLHSRSCISGHASRRALLARGLTEAQVREFFRKPITIHFGDTASASHATVSGGYGVRVYGD